MAFPFVAPFDNWVQTVLKQREQDKLIGVYKNPYAVLRSGAKVVKSAPKQTQSEKIQLLKDIISEKTIPDKEWKGCIISNNINNLELSYSKNQTPVGIDFDGNIITVDGESDSRVSTPIIENIDIDTDGANNTLKTATVTVRCFTLKQLELFEMFFMKPGMNVLLEFGDSSLLADLVKKIDKNNLKKELTVFRDGTVLPITPISKVEDCLINGKNFNEFVEEFGKYFRSFELEGIKEYFSKIEGSLGTYDLVAGKIIDFNFSIEENRTYLITLEISQSNQISLALPFSQKKNTSSINVPADDKNKNYSEREQIKDSLVLNFNLEKSILEELLKSEPHPYGKDWITDEFFNYNKIDTKQENQNASSTPYISLRFILHILMNYIISKEKTLDKNFFKFIIPKYARKIGEKLNERGERIVTLGLIEFIPILSNRNIISATDSIIFPHGEIPKFISAGKDGKVTIHEKERINGIINGYNLHRDLELWSSNGSTQFSIDQKSNPDNRLGDALNIFIKYEDVMRIWSQELYRIDFLEKILDLINKNSFGLFSLVYASIEENGPASILDYKLSINNKNKINPVKKESTYRFKMGANNSIVRNFSFNFEMSNLVAAATVYNSNTFISEALKLKDKPKARSQSSSETTVEKDQSIELTDDMYRSVSMSSMANADGYYSINWIEYNTLQKNLKDALKKSESLSTDTTQQAKSGTLTNQEATKQLSETEINEFIQARSVIFKTKNANKLVLIYKDSGLIYNLISPSKKEKDLKPTLSPISINLTVDGFSGFRCGYCFNVDGIPEIYNENGVFQITNIKHSINNEGWTTTIEADYLPRIFE